VLVFLTSIRHPHNSNNFAQVEKLFEISLRSVCAQTDPDFAVVVTCNVQPRIEFHDPRVIYHLVDYPPPSPERKAQIPPQALYRDKGMKLLAAMLRARSLNPDYFMIFDADDLVSRRVAAYANAHPNTPGWYVDAGYVINYQTQRMQRKHGMIRWCGTSLIPNARYLLQSSQVAEAFPDAPTPAEIDAQVDRSFVLDVLGNHVAPVGVFARQGWRMRPLPFRAIAWVQANEENHTMIRGAASGVPLTTSFAAEFGIAPPSPEVAGAVDFGARVRESLDCWLSWTGFLQARWSGRPVGMPPGHATR
jgi:hypothetical protein